MWPVLRRETGFVLAGLAGTLIFVALEVIYLRSLGRLVFLTGIPTPGGAPLAIHVFNMAVKGAWAALAYGGVMRLWFGRVSWRRLAALWAAGVVTVALLGMAAMARWIDPSSAALVGLAAPLVVSVGIARGWVTR